MMGQINDRNDMDNKTIEFWDRVFKKMRLLLIKIENTNPSIDDVELRWVSDRIEYWDTNDRILTKNEMLSANLYWDKYKDSKFINKG